VEPGLVDRFGLGGPDRQRRRQVDRRLKAADDRARRRRRRLRPFGGRGGVLLRHALFRFHFDLHCRLSRTAEARQQNADQQGHQSDDNQQLDKGKARTRTEASRHGDPLVGVVELFAVSSGIISCQNSPSAVS
jgi:hypothetical protein